MRNDRSTQTKLLANPGRRTTTTLNRKLRINQFFWIHVGVLVLLLLSFMVTGAVLIDLDQMKTVEDMRNDDTYLYYCLAGYVI